MTLKKKKQQPPNKLLKLTRRAQRWLFDTVAPRVKTAPSFIRDNTVSSAEGPPLPDNAAMSPSIHDFVYQTVSRKDRRRRRRSERGSHGDSKR